LPDTTVTTEGSQMRNHRKSTAAAIGLFVLLTGAIGGLLGASPDDMHWPTGSASATITVSAPHTTAFVDTLLD